MKKTVIYINYAGVVFALHALSIPLSEYCHQVILWNHQ